MQNNNFKCLLQCLSTALQYWNIQNDRMGEKLLVLSFLHWGKQDISPSKFFPQIAK